MSRLGSRRGSLKSNNGGIKNQVKSKLETMQALDVIKKDILDINSKVTQFQDYVSMPLLF